MTALPRDASEMVNRLDAMLSNTLEDRPSAQNIRLAARRILETILEPTKAMVDAGYAVGYSPDPLPCDEVWRAMVREALK